MRQTRLDFMPFSDEGVHGSWMVEKMTLTDEGYLSGRAIATNVGVFPYRMADGSIQWELRSAEEVFHPDSVATLTEKVMTNDHPLVKVTAENTKGLQVGFTGNVHQDQYHLAPKITITDKAAIEDVQQGKRGLSCGYTTDVIMEEGVAFGIHYDAIQTNIKYNHLAIVDKGRAGDAAKLKLDSIDSLGVLKLDIKNEESAIMPKFRVDDVEYEVPSDFITVFKAKEDAAAKVKKDSDTEIATMKTELSTEKARADAAEEANIKAKADLEEAKKGVSKEAMDIALAAKVKLLNSAEKAEVKVTADMSDRDIMKAVVVAVSPAAKEKVDECDDVYLYARFDAVVEKLTKDEEDSVLDGDTLGADGKKKDTHKDSKERTAEQARQDMIDYRIKLSKGKED